jgi:hypothetical protein
VTSSMKGFTCYVVCLNLGISLANKVTLRRWLFCYVLVVVRPVFPVLCVNARPLDAIR